MKEYHILRWLDHSHSRQHIWILRILQSKQVTKSLRDIYPRGKSKHENGKNIFAGEKYVVSKHIKNLDNTNEFADDVNRNLIKSVKPDKKR